MNHRRGKGLQALAGVACAAFVAIGASGCNVYRALSPSTHTDRVPPELPSGLSDPAILVYTKTNGFRHGEAIDAGTTLLRSIASENGWSIFHTENGAVFNARDLARFRVVVWHNASGDSLDAEQKAAFRAWLEAGHGYVGTHAAGDGSHTWPYYREALIGADYRGHPMGPQFQEALVEVEDRSHPASRELGTSFTHIEEWYSFGSSPREAGVHVLATVDENSYQPEMRMFGSVRDLRMGDDHPILWWRCAGAGRVLYSALGHRAEAYETPQLRAILEGGVRWAAGLEGPSCR